MNKLLLSTLPLLFSLNLYAQKQIEIGKVQNDRYVITADTVLLRKALQSTLGDATEIRDMHIESIQKWHYLVARGIQKNYTKTIAIELFYNISTQTYFAVEGLAHKTCASAGCNECEPFKENGNIIGCHCKSEGSVSNECNFKTVVNSPFHYQLSRYMQMKKTFVK
jgi:hypothetical protein